jgi:Protein of unknown function (DUF3455)
MHKLFRAFFIVALMVFGHLFSFSAKLRTAQQEVPAELRAPENERLLLQVRGKGDQIYSCSESGGKFSWVLKAPEAELTNMDGSAFGKHFAGPSWEAKDGSRVMGKAVANVASPEADAIPWLLITVVNRNGDGVLGKVTSIQRIRTKGGKAPANGCDMGHVGQEARVGYSADYMFFVAK